MVTNSLPAITIGIPFFNAEATLLDAVRSVFAQTHQDWELILLDDGSTDRSLELARSIKDPRVRVYSDGRNMRLAARLNQMTRLASHPYIARMDADDLMSSKRLEHQLRLLIEKPDVDFVATGICSLSDDYEPTGVRCVAPGHAITPRGLLAGKSGIVHASLLGRREWFLRNPYREDLAKSEDTNLWVRAHSKGDLRVAFIPEPLYFYREDGNVTPDKLRLAYRIGRVTIREDAGSGFSARERFWALAISYAKSAAIRLLQEIGWMELVRNRRNRAGMDENSKAQVCGEIRRIREHVLPLTLPVGSVRS